MRGMFGEITVTDNSGIRALKIGKQTQGSAFLEPDASIVSPGLSGPGPVAASAYTYGWLVAGTQSPSGDGLMIGLGSGVGASQFLYSFPKSTLTVVEIDSAIVTMALQSFPLLEHYLNEGRLNIIIKDASEYLGEAAEHFTWGLADAYTGKGNKHVVSYHSLLKTRCKEVYFNIIDTVDHALIKATQETFKDLGMPLKWLMRAVPPDLLSSPYVHTANWIVTSADINWDLVDAFEPFKGLDGPQVDWARICWNGLISSPTEL